MKPRFRQSMSWLHTWSGFVFSWLLFFIFITGTVGYFENEIDRWMKPEIAIVNEPIDDLTILKTAQQQLTTNAEDASQWYISYPSARDPYIDISWLQPANKETGARRQWHEKNLTPNTGELITTRETSGGETLYRLHYNLHYVPIVVGYLVTSLATMLMLIGLVTGVIIHKKIFIEFFTFRANKGLRSWLDIHNIFSVLPLPFHLMITYSGLILLMGISFAPVLDATICWTPNSQCSEQVVLRNMTAWVAVVRHLLDPNLAPKSLHFVHPFTQPQLRKLSDWFGCTVRGGMTSNKIDFPHNYLQFKFSSDNPLMHHTLTRLSKEQLTEIQAGQRVSHRVLSILMSKHDLQGVSQPIVANALNLTPRTLQRKLKNEHCTFAHLLDQERKRRYALLADAHRLGDIAALLGFNEQSSFNRAFKRWYGCAPKKFSQPDP